jgi:hypothetical protein
LNFLAGRAPVLPILLVSICSFGVASSNFWAISQHVSPASMVGRMIGYLNTISQIAGVLAPLITGWSLGPERNFTFAILLAGISPVIASVFLLAAGSAGLDRMKQTLSGNLQRAPVA